MTDSPASEEKKHCDVNSTCTAEKQDNINGGSDSTLDQSDSNHGASASVGSSNAPSSVKSGADSQAQRPSRIPKVRTPRRGACGNSSSDESSDDEVNENDDEINIPSYHNSRAAPRNRNNRGSNNNDDNTTAGDSASADNHGENNNSSGVSPDQERQILLLMLLAQVCALHDPTPRTFTVHVLELFERGILGRQSIHFLFELGLVPSSAPRLLPPSTTGMESDATNQQVLDLATISPTASPVSPQSLRTQEASAIRNHLEQHDLAQETPANLLPPQGGFTNNNNNNNTALTSTTDSPTKQNKKATSSWAVEHHPLSLSRYQREFHQVRLLNAGSFGEVFQATSKIDLRDYAVKRVAFSAWGYSKDSVTQVIREVHCLAQCDHPHVVRYYTSWLEPSWMTGSGATMISSTGNSSAEVRHQQKLLTDIQHMMLTGGDNNTSLLEQSQQQSSVEDSGNNNSNSNLQNFFRGQVASLRDRKFSIGSSLGSFNDNNSAGSSYDETSSDEGSCSHHWTAVEDDPNRSRDDSILFQSHRREVWESSSSAPRRCKTQGNASRKQPPSLKYRYQICLFIQMQLCHPATLGDWIRNRNLQTLDPHQDRHQRVQRATKIFGQIVSGLNHIHKKNIVHRDLKPANLFRSLEDDGVFLIGDFGLSKLIHSATHHNKRQKQHSEENAPVYHPPAHSDAITTWQDPLTAGVGTASYAANEQVTTRTYGKPADIFSLGLILLELVCCFGTEHERMQTFNDCRNRRDVPSWITKEYPVVASTILACTESDPRKRPVAEELLDLDILDAPSITTVSNCEASPDANVSGNSPHQTDNVVAQLRQELANKNEEIQRFRNSLNEKDQTIEELRRELAQLRTNQPELASSHLQYLSTSLTVQEVASSSSSSGDEGM